MVFTLDVLCAATDTARIKCVALHPRYPYLLASTMNGKVRFWNYERRESVFVYETGGSQPVRCACFHPTDPFFACGTDAGDVIVFNYVERREVCVLKGHADYVRGVQFHPSRPWLLSCSDDQTVLVWDHVRQRSIALLGGANHYVMSALFALYTDREFIISCSLDQTIRAWDLTPLIALIAAHPHKDTKEETKPPSLPMRLLHFFYSSDAATETRPAIPSSVATGHTRGINCLALDEKSGTLLSGADDYTIRLWQRAGASGSYAQIGVIQKHTGNLTALSISRCTDCFFSTSEDATMAVHARDKELLVHRWTSTIGQLWSVACHASKPIVAVGGDDGFYVFSYGEKE